MQKEMSAWVGVGPNLADGAQAKALPAFLKNSKVWVYAYR
jgi:hypothetical protein